MATVEQRTHILRRLSEMAMEDVVDLREQLAAALDRVAALEKALRSYGRHGDSCERRFGGDCSCGFAALAVPPDSPGGTR